MMRDLLSRGGPQTKKIAYLVVIAAGVVWLTVGLWVPIRAEWNVAFGFLLGAVTTGYVGGKKVALAGAPVGNRQPSPASDVSVDPDAKIGGTE